MRDRPSWDDYLLGLAKWAALRSHDSQTKHGCILVDSNHCLLGMGYNGFPRGMKDDKTLPTTRPDKYDWMIHAEQNAICSATSSLKDSTAYVTGLPCRQCLMMLWQHGVTRVVHIDGAGWQKDEQERHIKEEFLRQSGMVVQAITPNFDWIVDFVLDDKDLGPLFRERCQHEDAVTFVADWKLHPDAGYAIGEREYYRQKLPDVQDQYVEQTIEPSPYYPAPVETTTYPSFASDYLEDGLRQMEAIQETGTGYPSDHNDQFLEQEASRFFGRKLKLFHKIDERPQG